MNSKIRRIFESLRQLPDLIHAHASKRFPVTVPAPSFEESIKRFKISPDQYFYVDHHLLDWENIFRDDGFGTHYAGNIRVKVRGRTLGYIERTFSADRGASFVIGHFAVAPDCVGTGVATVMANVLKARLRERYKTKKIIFEEDHPHFSKRDYKQFFTRLGATNPDPNSPRRWEWDISQHSGACVGAAPDER